MITLARWLTAARDELAAVGPQARLEAELVLARVLGKPRGYAYAWPERELTVEQQQHLRWALDERLQGQPLAYITGQREFWSLPLKVSPAVLIPRPETERLVELALAKIPSSRRCLIADLGTGSGAIALAIASERPRARIVATDSSRAALALARENARRLQLDTVDFAAGHWFDCAALTNRRFRLLVSNPPYVTRFSPYLRGTELAREPASALIAGHDGMQAIRAIVERAPSHLTIGGWLLLEHGFDQAVATQDVLRKRGFVAVNCHRDLAGVRRVTLGQWRR